MVEMPRIRPHNITSEPGRSAVTQDTASGPYRMLSDALDRVGLGVRSVAQGETEFAARTVEGTGRLLQGVSQYAAGAGAEAQGAARLQAGTAKLFAGAENLVSGVMSAARPSSRTAETSGGSRRVVTLDQKGDAQLSMLPILDGDGDSAYARAAQVNFIAETDPAIRGQITTKIAEFEGSPQDFKEWADAYVQDLTGRETDPIIQQTVGAIAQRHADEAYLGLLTRRDEGDRAKAGLAIRTRLSGFSDELTMLASAGGVDLPEYQQRQQDFLALVGEAVNNPLIDFAPDEGKILTDRAVARAQVAAVTGMVRRANDEHGPAGAQIFADAAAELNNVPETRARLADEMDSLQAQAAQRAVAQARKPIEAREMIERSGQQLALAGGLDQDWLDLNRDHLSLRVAEQLRQAALVQPAARSDMGTYTGLLSLAVTGNPDFTEAALDAKVARDIAPGALTIATRIAGDVAADVSVRPWANDLRQQFATRIGDAPTPRRLDALVEFSDWLTGAKEATREDAQKHFDVVYQQFAEADNREMRAVLPLPRFAGVPRAEMTPEIVGVAHQRAVQSAQIGTMTLAELASEARHLDGWRTALAQEA